MSWHVPHLQRQGTSSIKEYIFMVITSFSTSSYAIHADAFKTSIYILPTKLKMPLILPSLDFTEISLLLLWILQITSQWHENIPYGMLLYLHYSFGQKTLIQSPSVELQSILQHIFLCLYEHTLHQQPDETLFGHFNIALNTAFNQQLSLADEGYESGSDTIDLPTHLWKTPCIHHISSMENISFNPVFTTPCSTLQKPPRPVCRCLSFSSADNYTPDSTPVCSDILDDEEEEDFQMVPLDDEHWISEETPDITYMHSWTWTTAWIMPVPMSSHEL